MVGPRRARFRSEYEPSWRSKTSPRIMPITRIKGDPCIDNKPMIFPKPALNATASLVAAPARTVDQRRHLPLRGFAGRFKR